jgi:hypothetical protein
VDRSVEPDEIRNGKFIPAKIGKCGSSCLIRDCWPKVGFCRSVVAQDVASMFIQPVQETIVGIA